MRAAVIGILLVSVGLAGCVDLTGGQAQAEALQSRRYVTEVQVAIQTLSMVFGQADESVRSVNQGWLAPQGAASQFHFLNEQVKSVKVGMNRAQPPPDMANFHLELGRSVTMTQQAMDAMQNGFTTGDGTYFDLAQEKLTLARTMLDRAVKEL